MNILSWRNRNEQSYIRKRRWRIKSSSPFPYYSISFYFFILSTRIPVHLLLSFSIWDKGTLETTTFLSVEVGYIQPRSVGGDGYDIAVFNPRETIGGKFGFGKIVNFLAGQGLFNLFHFGYVLRRICQLLVELGVGRHVGLMAPVTS